MPPLSVIRLKYVGRDTIHRERGLSYVTRCVSDESIEVHSLSRAQLSINVLVIEIKVFTIALLDW